jgi:hypothetical protein
MNTPRFLRAAAASALAVALTTACADEATESIDIVSPAAGDRVNVPFEVTIDTSVPLGPPSEGLHHVHLWFGDGQSVFLVGESPTILVDNAPNGEHMLRISLHYADHTPAGAEIAVPLIISGGADLPGDDS